MYALECDKRVAMDPTVQAPVQGLSPEDAVERLRAVVAALPEGSTRRDADAALDVLAVATGASLRMLLERAPDCVAVHCGAKLLFANAVLRKQLGYELEEMVGRATMDFVHPDDREVVAARVRDAMVHGRAAPPRVDRFVTRDGSPCLLEVSSLPFVFEGVPAVVVFGRDVTARLKAESDRAEALGAAERALAARDAVLAIVSHDLRSPLATVRAAGELTLRTCSEERARTCAEATLRAVARMERLIADLLDVASIDAGRLKVDLSLMHIAPALDEAVEALRPEADARGVLLELLPSVDTVVSGDRGRLHQVLTNLVGNAVRYSPPGCAVVLQAKAVSAGVRVSVSDRGPGVPADDIGRVFERYYRGPTEGVHTGRGLGLYIARGIIEAHGGRIGVDAGPDRGSTFWFDLPTE